MKALVYTAPLMMQILDVDPPIPKPGEVLVQVSAVGICGSELEGFTSRSPFRVPPLIMGHEFSGVRADDGTPVAVNPVVSCGVCDLCLRGLTNICRTRSIIGIQRPGAFAECVAVPEANCYPLSPHFPLKNAALVEPLANAAHAFRLAQAHDAAPMRVAVIGAGALGFLTALIAARRGVPSIVISDLSEQRRKLAVSSGATDVVETLDGEFDVIFDAVGSARTRQQSVDLLRPGGTAVWIGLHGPDAGADGLALIRGEKRILGTFCYQDQDYRAAIDIAEGLSTNWVATVPLANGVPAFLALANGDVTHVKTVLEP